MSNYFENQYSNKMENSEEKDELLDPYELPKQNQEEKKILNNPISFSEVEEIITN